MKLKQIFRSILRYKTSSVLTLLSLVVSFLGVIILTLYVTFEKSFDRFHVNGESIYIIETKLYAAALPAVMAKDLEEHIPEIGNMSVFAFDYPLVSTPKLLETNKKYAAQSLYAGEAFFEMFTFPLVMGDAATALKEPNTVVLTESLSEKLFGQANPMGETVLLNGESYSVQGVMKDVPRNSSFQPEAIASFATYLKDGRNSVNSWSEWSFNIFVQLNEGANVSEILDKMVNNPNLSDDMQEHIPRFADEGFFTLRPLREIHFNPQGFFYSYTNLVVLNVLIILAVMLAVMGAVNFINFSTSQAPLRTKALAVTQILGGNRTKSMWQIILESIIFSLLSLLIAFGIYSLTYPQLEKIFGISGLDMEGRYEFIWLFAITAILFGFVAALYPARYITSSPVVQSVKGNAYFRGKGRGFRNMLITVQFVFTIALVASALVIEKQLKYWRNFDIGIDKEHVVFLRPMPDLIKHHKAFAEELMKNDKIGGYTYSRFIPGGVHMSWGMGVDGQQIQTRAWPVDENFIDFFGIEMVEGRKFMKDSQADENTFILNEKAVEVFGWEKPLEKRLPMFEGGSPIIGIAKNFNFSSLKEDIEPMILWLTESRIEVLMLRILPGNYTQTIDYIKETALKFDPLNPVEVKFLDDSLNQLYEKEEKTARFIEFVSLWCILLAITGLLGLIVFMCRDRIKEIGIRKVNGAKISEVMIMLNNNVIRWIIVAFVLAVPIAWFAMNKWLTGFAYRTPLNWWIFALSGIIVLGIAFFTVSWQSWRAARKNPVEALRYE